MLLFDGGTEILATFGNKLSAIGRKELEATGVEVHTESVVTYLDASHLEVKGANGSVERYAAQTKIWAAGVAASPLARKLGRRLGRRMRSQRPYQGSTRLLAPGLPRGVRGRRHDEL